jgi:hypothetical protein
MTKIKYKTISGNQRRDFKINVSTPVTMTQVSYVTGFSIIGLLY